MRPPHQAAEATSVKRIFLSDCEGPISKNDNAYEATAHFVPNGDKLFSIISKYDDVLADTVKKPGYNAGDTLKLVLPFLKAYGVSDQALREFSSENLLLIAGTRETLQHVKSLMDSFIVSTSYEHYIKALCDELAFPFENTYCTRLSLDKYGFSDRESERLREFAAEIAPDANDNDTREREGAGRFFRKRPTDRNAARRHFLGRNQQNGRGHRLQSREADWRARES